jgi:hypothetical protein
MAIENWEGKRSKEPMGGEGSEGSCQRMVCSGVANPVFAYTERAAERIEEWQSDASAPLDGTLATSSQAQPGPIPINKPYPYRQNIAAVTRSNQGLQQR